MKNEICSECFYCIKTESTDRFCTWINVPVSKILQHDKCIRFSRKITKENIKKNETSISFV